MPIAYCGRCGKDNEVDEMILQLPKCKHCEGIRFQRESFASTEKQVIRNFELVKRSELGSITKSLYVFGSYARKERDCGDIDFLATYSKHKLEKLANAKIRNCRSNFRPLVYGHHEYKKLKPILYKSFWDFRTCQEYPDCLDCYDNPWCRLPEEDYCSGFVTYCIDRCRGKTKQLYPPCSFENCQHQKSEVADHILETIAEALKKEVKEHHETNSGLKVKIVDLVMKPRCDDLAESFGERGKASLQLYRINSPNGKWKRITIHGS